MVTRQPSFSSPTRLATGTRTSLRNSSANSSVPGDGAQRPDLDAGRVHGHDEPRDAAVALVARAHEQLAEVRHDGVGRPDLRAGDDVVVAVAHGPGAQRGQVAPRVGLAEALAPHLLAAQDGREVALLLGAGALGDDRRPRVQQPDEVHPDVGRPRPLALLLEDQLLHRRGAAPTTFDRPVDAGVARLEEEVLPAAGRRPAGRASRHGAAARPRRAGWRPASRAARRGTPAPDAV